MGQYYKAVIEKGNETLVFNPHTALTFTANGIARGTYADFEKLGGLVKNLELFCGMKLIEQSWTSNVFVAGVMDVITDNPAKVAWVGDYAEDFDGYERIWDDDVADNGFAKMPVTDLTGYLVNRDNGEFIDLDAYVKAATDGDGWCIHPLPLLTAVGNGLGSGDYRRDNAANMVGSWALSTIEHTHERPEGEDITSKIRFRW